MVVIWNRLPKSVFVGADVLYFDSYDAVAHFNIRPKAAIDIFKELGLVPGEFFEVSVGNIDKMRIKKAQHRNTPEVKKKRKFCGEKKRWKITYKN